MNGENGWMTKEEFEAELMYRAALSPAKAMMKKGLLSQEEYTQIDNTLLDQFHPPLGLLLAGKKQPF